MDAPVSICTFLRKQQGNETQEALSNIARHSHATRVQISLECGEEQAELSIADNGQGFDPTKVNGAGVGLHSMQERMEALGGTLSIESAVGQGTRLLVRCPGESGSR